MHSKVSSDWLPRYIKATRAFLEIFKMAGYFPDGPRTRICVFMDLKTYSDYFTTQHEMIRFYKQDGVRLLRGTKWIFIHSSC